MRVQPVRHVSAAVDGEPSADPDRGGGAGVAERADSLTAHRPRFMPRDVARRGRGRAPPPAARRR
jgi:hypothetical protein